MVVSLRHLIEFIGCLGIPVDCPVCLIEEVFWFDSLQTVVSDYCALNKLMHVKVLCIICTNITLSGISTSFRRLRQLLLSRLYG